MPKIDTSQPTHCQRILDAASDVFLVSGYEKTSTAEIARLAKVSKRELYLHFSDKRTLLAAVVQDLQGQMQQRMDNTWGSHAQLEKVLLASAKVIQGFILSERFGKLMRTLQRSPTIAPSSLSSSSKPGPARDARPRLVT